MHYLVYNIINYIVCNIINYIVYSEDHFNCCFDNSMSTKMRRSIFPVGDFGISRTNSTPPLNLLCGANLSARCTY